MPGVAAKAVLAKGRLPTGGRHEGSTVRRVIAGGGLDAVDSQASNIK